ncbi:DUF3967 domain-containing protein [Bacillus taeanensis]|uniref:DUF3967 domain-containing protein n=1 Tax=Bacillus taeanensis TaxID=273032 RepID=A0A366XNH7_9BACI|nr:DUF3967 domain-containing protein [Bacillus taeanensis]RBW67286.1 hypothetical protein DS031_23075 [Bacillus taeanensis]
MTDNTETTEKAYTTKDIALMIDIAEPTVRKYAQTLEKAGYQFIKGENGNRIFIENDAMVIRHLKELRKKTNISVEQAANVVVSKHEKKPIQGVSLPDIPQNPQYDERYEQLEKKIDQQNEMIEKLITTLEERDKKRDEMLMQHIREVQETKKLLLEESSESKKGFFAKLFGK